MGQNQTALGLHCLSKSGLLKHFNRQRKQLTVVVIDPLKSCYFIKALYYIHYVKIYGKDFF